MSTATLRLLRWAPNWCCSVAVLCGAALLPGCAKDDASGAGGPPRGAAEVPVRVAPVVERLLPPRVIVVGTVTPKRRSMIASGAEGVVASYTVEEGEWIEKDTELSQLRMESTKRMIAEAEELAEQYKQEWKETESYRAEEIAQAKFREEAAKIVRDTAAKKYVLEKEAFEKGAINEDQFIDAQERKTQTEALYQAALQNHRLMQAGPRKEKRLQAERKMKAQQEHLAFLKAEAAKRTTKAPFAGFVVKEHSYIGQWLSKGDPVATVAMLDDVDVVVNVDQSDVRYVRIGGPAQVRIQGFELVSIETRDGQTHGGMIHTESIDDVTLLDERGRIGAPINKSDIVKRQVTPWDGTVVQIVPKSDWQTGSRGFPVKVRIRNRFRYVTVKPEKKGDKPRRRKLPVLKEGLMATVTFEGRPVKRYLVSKDALVRTTSGLKIHVFTPGKDDPKRGSTHWIGVTTGEAVGDLIEVIPESTNGNARPLARGMSIVTEGGENLRPVQGGVVIKEKPAAESER